MFYLLNPDIVAENERAPAGLRTSALGVLAHVAVLIKAERD